MEHKKRKDFDVPRLGSDIKSLNGSSSRRLYQFIDVLEGVLENSEFYEEDAHPKTDNKSADNKSDNDAR